MCDAKAVLKRSATDYEVVTCGRAWHDWPGAGCHVLMLNGRLLVWPPREGAQQLEAG